MESTRIFVFEDEWMCREAIQVIIQRSPGLELIGSASNPELELEAAIGLKPDIVLMDLRLNGTVGGIKASQILLQRSPDTRVIIFTHHADNESLNAAVEAGVSGYLLKEEISNPSILVEAIHEIALGHSYMTPTICSQILRALRKRDSSNDLGLTLREVEILRLISSGKQNREVANDLQIRERTVANHVSNILFKINARNRTEAAAIAHSHGLV